MKISDLSRQLELHFKTKRNLWIEGPAGLGKSQVVKDFAASKGVKLIEYRAAYCEPGDLKGLPNPEDGVMKFLRPEDLPTEQDVNCILFFDEINRASTAVMNCIMQATDSSRRIGTHRLPKGCLVIAATNPDHANHNVGAVDFALLNRFKKVKIEYDRAALVDYARAKAWHPRVIGFIQSDVNLFGSYDQFDGKDNIPTPRVLEALSDEENAGLLDEYPDCHLDAAIGYLGPKVGQQYHAYATGEQPVTLAELYECTKDALARVKRFSDPDTARRDLISVTNSELVAAYTKGAAQPKADQHKAVIDYLCTLPADMAVGVLKSICVERPDADELFKHEAKLMKRIGDRLKPATTETKA